MPSARSQFSPVTQARLLLRFLLVVSVLSAVPASAAPNLWTPFGPTGGRVNDIVIDPAHPEMMWIASAGMVYASVDGGTSWNQTNSGLEGQGISFLALDPAQPGVLYAANSLPAPTNVDPAIFRTLNAGAHWTRVATLPGQNIFSLAVAPGAPGAPGVVFAGTPEEIVRSLDGGATFQVVLSRTSVVIFRGIEPDPQHPGTVYAVSTYRRSKSVDFGTTWVDLDESPGHPPPFISGLAVAPSDPQTLVEAGGIAGGMTWRSRNGGATWDGPFASSVEVLTIDPVDPFTVYGGSAVGLFVSRDGGVNWVPVTAGLPPLSVGQSAYYGVNAFATVPGRAGFVIAATGRGLFESDDAGAHWHGLAMRGVFTNQIEDFRIDPFNPAHWTLNSQGTRLVSHDGGFTFSLLPATFNLQRIDAVEFDPFVRNRMWLTVRTASTGKQLYRSNDGGATWTRVTGTIPDGPQLLVPAQGVLLLAGSGISRSTDGGHTWKKVQSGAIGNPDSDNAIFLHFSRLVRDPRTQRTAYALGDASKPHGASFFVIYRSDDAGATWRLWNTGGQSIVFNPAKPKTIDITQNRTLLVTSNNGVSFQTVGDLGLTGYPWVLDLIFDLRNPATLYAATYADGVKQSRDGGVTWEIAAPGLPSNSPVYQVVQDTARRQRFYATPQIGELWRADFTP
ncbi:MAG TPA: hypothetical protein VH988_06240 [Thermoanaerobaculia bacterium]|nr:hypothetical protein [Thermoanaerobaculia bacterium]